MKKSLIMFFIISICVIIYAQDDKKLIRDNKFLFSRLEVSLTADSKGAYEKNILDSDIIQTLSKYKPLTEMKVVSYPHNNSLSVKFNFDDITSFYEWYDNKDTQVLLENIEKRFKNYKLDLLFTKSTK